MSDLYHEFTVQVTKQAEKLPDQTLAAAALIGVATALLEVKFGTVIAASTITTLTAEALKRGDT